MRESQQGSPYSRARGCARHATQSAPPLFTSPARIIDDYGYMTPHMLATKCCRECWMQMICLLLLRAESEGEHIDAVFVCSLHPRHGYACNRCDAHRRSGFRSSILHLLCRRGCKDHVRSSCGRPPTALLCFRTLDKWHHQNRRTSYTPATRRMESGSQHIPALTG